jgi:hypothetical protein
MNMPGKEFLQMRMLNDTPEVQSLRRRFYSEFGRNNITRMQLDELIATLEKLQSTTDKIVAGNHERFNKRRGRQVKETVNATS